MSEQEPQLTDPLNFSAMRAFATTVASSAALETLGPILEQIRAAANEGRLSCSPTLLTDVHRVILFHLGYGSSSDGSIHWSGLERFGPDPMASNTSRDYELKGFSELAEASLRLLSDAGK